MTLPPPSCVLIHSFFISHFSLFSRRYLHHNFVCALLNDLFGVQARAGCQCAGPYGVRLLSMSDSSLPKMKRQVEADVGIMKPGFCRLSLTFFMSDAEASLACIGNTSCVLVSQHRCLLKFRRAFISSCVGVARA